MKLLVIIINEIYEENHPFPVIVTEFSKTKETKKKGKKKIKKKVSKH